MTRSSRDGLDWALLGGLVVMWGTSFLVIKFTVGSVPPATVIASRLLLGTVLLFLAMRVLGQRLEVPRGGWTWLFWLAVMGVSLPFFLIVWGQQKIDSGLAGILVGFMPLVTAVLAHYFAGEHLTRWKVAGFMLGLAGIVVLNGPEAARQLAGAGGELLERMALLGAGICYAINTIIARRMPPMPALTVASASTLIAAAVTTLIALVADAPWTLRPSSGAVAACIWLGVVPTAIANIVYFRLIARAGPSFMSMTNYLTPIVAVGAGFVVFGERPAETSLLGMLLVLAGIGLATRSLRTG